MANAYLKITRSVSETDAKCTVTYTLYYYGNGASWSNYSCKWTLGGNSGTSTFTTSTSAQKLGTYSTSYTKGTSTATKTVSATFATGVSIGTLTTSDSYTVPALTKYTVTYNKNGGTAGSVTSQSAYYGKSITISSSASCTRTGYTFLGWSTSSSATSATYTAGSSYTVTKNITLYAVWKINTYTISYNGNGSTSGSVSSQTKTYGVALTLRSNSYAKTGYTFSKWNTASGGTGTPYSAGGSYTANSAATLYAQWTINSYNLTCNPNGGTSTATSGWTASGSNLYKAHNYNAAYTFPSNPTRTGYTFKGWYTASSGGTQVTTSTKMGTAAVTIYAQWTANTYTLTINPNGGTYNSTTDESTKTMTYAATTNNNIGVATQEGYTFNGWYTATSDGIQIFDSSGNYNSSATDYWSSGKWIYTSPLPVYAQWTVSYDSPKISNVTCRRAALTEDGNGYENNEEGTYVHLSFDYEFDSTLPTEIISGTYTFYSNGTSKWYESLPFYYEVTPEEGDSPYGKGWYEYDEDESGYELSEDTFVDGTKTYYERITSGTVDVYSPQKEETPTEFSTETTYSIKIELDDNLSNSKVYSTFLSKSYFTMDFGSKGYSVGIGTSAVDLGSENYSSKNARLDIGMSHIYQEIKALDYKERGTWAGLMVANSYTSTKVTLEVGSGGYNHGIYSEASYVEGSPTSNPSSEGYYEFDDSNYTYSASEDTTIDSSKTYYKYRSGSWIIYKDGSETGYIIIPKTLKSIYLANANYLYGYNSSGTAVRTIGISSGNSLLIGDITGISGSVYLESPNSIYFYTGGANHGNMNANGDLTVSGHNSAIGTVKTANLSAAKDVASKTGTALCSISLPAGTWVCACFIRWDSNATGFRRGNLDTSSGATDIHSQIAAAASGYTIQMNWIEVLSPSQTTTYYLNGWQNSGSSLTVSAGDSNGYITGIRAVRIA